MAIISSVSIKNYKCYRHRQVFSLNDATFFVGGNNAGKSVVLKAIKCFFDSGEMRLDDFNQTEIKSRQAGSNVLEIELSFDVAGIKSEARYVKEIKAIAKNGDGFLNVMKKCVYREANDYVDFEYLILSRDEDGDDYYYAPDKSVLTFLEKFSVSYLHPQEVDRLLSEAQEKLKIRLLSKFGRGTARFDALESLENSWREMREEANRDLSVNLTTELRKVWPESSATVELPQSIDEIVAISEIKFKGVDYLPEVSLSEQGNGVQSAVLYQTHYLLDSDKTIHRGVYFPIWLVEEPESFLHADIVYKLGKLLVSNEWLGVVQMVVTTHSPLILAASAYSEKEVAWTLLNQAEPVFSKSVSTLEVADFDLIGTCLGDPNFEVYFSISSALDSLVIEDSRKLTNDVLIKSGLPVTKALTGSSELKKYVDTLGGFDLDVSSNVVFLLDNDKGARELKNVITVDNLYKSEGEFRLYKIKDYLWIILLPEGNAIENLFEEYDSFLAECVWQLYDFDDDVTDGGATTARPVSPDMSRAHADIRGKARVGSLIEAMRQIEKCQDVKDKFWREVDVKGLVLKKENVDSVLCLLRDINFVA